MTEISTKVKTKIEELTAEKNKKMQQLNDFSTSLETLKGEINQMNGAIQAYSAVFQEMNPPIVGEVVTPTVGDSTQEVDVTPA